MKITNSKTIRELGYKTSEKFPEEERKKIEKAIEDIEFKNFDDYSKRDAFDNALAERLKDDFSINVQIFDKTKHALDLYNSKLKIGIEIEKTKTTTLLLDVIKFIAGYKNKKIDYGVLVFPDKYRTKSKPKGDQDIFYNRIINELKLIECILEIKDILVVEYDTRCFFK